MSLTENGNEFSLTKIELTITLDIKGVPYVCNAEITDKEMAHRILSILGIKQRIEFDIDELSAAT